jgi:hypothetical protein
MSRVIVDPAVPQHHASEPASPAQRHVLLDWPVRLYKALIWVTLYGASLHFFDNVYFFDQYPEPAWLTSGIVGALWIPLALLAHRAVHYIYTGRIERSYSLVHGFVLGNWISLGHYLFASPAVILPRINLAIAVQVGFASLLLIMTLWLQFTHSPDTLRWARKAWVKNLLMYVVVIYALEILWPSRFDPWWMWWRT